MNRPYLLILHLHFLPCPPHLPLPQCHYLPLHYQYHLLNPSYFHHCFLKKKKSRGNSYLMQTGRTGTRAPNHAIMDEMNSQISTVVSSCPSGETPGKHASSLIYTSYEAKQSKTKIVRKKVTNSHKHLFTSLLRVNQ